MTDFGNYGAKYATKAEYTIYGLEGYPALIVVPATEENPAYMNKILKDTRKNMRIINQDRLTAAQVQQYRERDYVLFAKHVVVGFKDVLDAEGNEVPWNMENAEEFLRAIPTLEFDELRDFCGSIGNFAQTTGEDHEDLAKN